MLVDRPSSWWCCHVLLEEVVEHAMDGTPHNAIGVVLATADPVLQMEQRALIQGRHAAEFVARLASCPSQVVGPVKAAVLYAHERGGGLDRGAAVDA